jgi:hypothetical protein
MSTMSRLVFLLWVASLSSPAWAAATPRIRITITKTEPLDSSSYGAIGTYEKLTGLIWGEEDPADPRNAIITDLNLAPTNSNGMVDYSAEFVLVKPVDMSKGNGILRYDAPNRGNLLSFPPDPVLLRRGYSILYGAWQGDVPKSSPNRLTLTVPVARNRDGSSITGIYRTELLATRNVGEIDLPGSVFNGSMIPYPPASLDNTAPQYSLTKRVNEADPRVVVPNRDWRFATTSEPGNPFPGRPDPRRVSLRGGFDPRYIYELIYVAKDPKVMGLGLAALRDYVTFLRTAEKDSFGNTNPLAGRITHVIATGISQSGNFLKTFIHLGFNEARGGQRVFDGVFSHVAARHTQINARFSTPGGGVGFRTDHTALGQTAPRALGKDFHDPLTGRTGGVMKRSAQSGTSPKYFLAFSGTEFWVLQGSPVLTDVYGTEDLEQPENVRIYHFASSQHGGTGTVSWNPSNSLYPAGTMNQHNDTFRALYLALEDWVVRGVAPPASRIPRISDGTLVRPEEVVFPVMKGVSWTVGGTRVPIPEFKYLGWYNNWAALDFGPRQIPQDDSGIADYLPPRPLGKDYAILVPKVDADGLDLAGIRTVDIQAPLGTSLGFNYAADPRQKDLLGLTGGYIPFHQTKAARLLAEDSRLSLEERYGSQDGYVDAVRRATATLVEQRFLLDEDARRLVRAASERRILP